MQLRCAQKTAETAPDLNQKSEPVNKSVRGRYRFLALKVVLHTHDFLSALTLLGAGQLSSLNGKFKYVHLVLVEQHTYAVPTEKQKGKRSACRLITT